MIRPGHRDGARDAFPHFHTTVRALALPGARRHARPRLVLAQKGGLAERSRLTVDHLSSAPCFADWVLGGWAAAGITTLSAGNRVNLSVQGNPSSSGKTDRPNLLRDPRLSRDQRSLDRWFDTDAFQRQPNYTFGNAPRNAIEAPGIVNFDLALFKLFRVAERVELQFRAEAFNAMNTPNFGKPGAQLGASGFGVISSADDSRTLQFGLKLRF